MQYAVLLYEGVTTLRNVKLFEPFGKWKTEQGE